MNFPAVNITKVLNGVGGNIVAVSMSAATYEGCSESNAPHFFFLGNYLFRMYEIHAQYNWMFPLHMLFFHIILIYVYGLTPATRTRNEHGTGKACMPLFRAGVRP
jgi:hypothetical protein